MSFIFFFFPFFWSCTACNWFIMFFMAFEHLNLWVWCRGITIFTDMKLIQTMWKTTNNSILWHSGSLSCPIWKTMDEFISLDPKKPYNSSFNLKTLLARTLFEWSRIWEFTHYSSLSDFLISVSLSLWFDCIFFKGSVFIIVNTLFFSSIKLLLSIKKKLNKSFNYPQCFKNFLCFVWF